MPQSLAQIWVHIIFSTKDRRPIIGDVARRFLRCGDLHFGFARVRCPDCQHEMFVAYSCQQRCLCPSCHQKRSLLA